MTNLIKLGPKCGINIIVLNDISKNQDRCILYEDENVDLNFIKYDESGNKTIYGNNNELFFIPNYTDEQQETIINNFKVTQTNSNKNISKQSNIYIDKDESLNDSLFDMEVVNILNKLLDDFGVSVVEDRNRFNSILSDYSKGKYKGEIHLLNIAIDAGVINEIKINGNNFDVIKSRYMQKLKNDYGLIDNQAKFTIETWYSLLNNR